MTLNSVAGIFLVITAIYLVYKAQQPEPVKVQSILDEYFPYSLVKEHSPDYYSIELPLKVPFGAKSVVYWAADGSNSPLILPVRQAYNTFDNSGVANVDGNNVALIRLALPQPYYLPNGEILDSHIHYRILDVSGKMSETHQISLSDLKEQREFTANEWSYLPSINAGE